jgi:GTP-binding protein
MDIRHPLKDFDWQMLEWCHHFGLPAHVLLTKADKLKRGAQQNTLLAVRRELAGSGSDATAQTFSALDKTGLPSLIDKLDDWLQFTPDALSE